MSTTLILRFLSEVITLLQSSVLHSLYFSSHEKFFFCILKKSGSLWFYFFIFCQQKLAFVTREMPTFPFLIAPNIFADRC